MAKQNRLIDDFDEMLLDAEEEGLDADLLNPALRDAAMDQVAEATGRKNRRQLEGELAQNTGNAGMDADTLEKSADAVKGVAQGNMEGMDKAINSLLDIFEDTLTRPFVAPAKALEAVEEDVEKAQEEERLEKQAGQALPEPSPAAQEAERTEPVRRSRR